MPTLYALAALAGFVTVVACVSDSRLKNPRISPYLALVAICLLARLLLWNSAAGYENDINTFKSWAGTLHRNGISNFYGSAGYADYPPGYMYVLYLIGALRDKLNLSPGAFTALIKLPGILCDCAVTAFVYRLAAKKFAPKAAFLTGLAYALNPAIILNSAVWGQVDSVLILLVLASVNWLADKKYVPSFALYALAVLIKPQALIAAPVFPYAAYDAIVCAEKGCVRKTVLRLLLGFGVALAVIFALCLPFAGGLRPDGFGRIFGAYLTAVEAYPHATVNAYNLFAFAGGNWKSVDNGFLGMSYGIWGMIFYVLIVIFGLFMLDRAKGKKSAYFAVTAILFALTFMFWTKMHERYMLPALVFFLVAFIHKPDKRFALFYGGFTLTAFVNCADVLHMLHNGNDSFLITVSMQFISLVNIILAVILIAGAVIMYRKEPLVPEREEDLPHTPFYERRGKVTLEKQARPERFNRRDCLLMAGLTLLYAAIAFINLGDFNAPQTTWKPARGQSAVIGLLGGVPAATFQYYPGARHAKSFALETSPDGVNWGERDDLTGLYVDEYDDVLGPGAMEFKTDAVFRWKFEKVNILEPYVRFTSLDDMLLIQEIGFRDAEGNLIPAVAIDGGTELCDEQEWVPERVSYMNSTYFDEIYHARTGYEFYQSGTGSGFVNGLSAYEDTHPPLGKDIIAAGIAIFGMTPFGWRFMGTLCGILMIPLLYVFAKRMFGKSEWALFAASIFAFDFMHFAQTRIATIDSYVTFFVMGMYLFMYEYSRTNFFDSGINQNGKGRHSAFVKSLFMLVCCGAVMGLAVSAKWQGIYGVIGLPVMLFYTLYKRLREYLYAKKHCRENAMYDTVRYFPWYIWITAAVCVAAFLVIPAVIYCASYVPFLRSRGVFETDNGLSVLRNSFNAIIDNQKYMFNYHRQVSQAHAYSSRWFEWPLMLRPIYFYTGSPGNGLREGITSFGNPALWWMGIAALVYAVKRQSREFSGALLFLLVAYASQYLPWIFIGRTTYIYHYFPSVPFVALLVTFFFKDYVAVKRPKLVWGYVIAVVALFALFYPVIAGAPVPRVFAEALRWMPGWVLG